MPIRILEFYKEAQISAILRCVRYTFLAIFGHREAELTARSLLQQLSLKYTHPVMLILLDALRVRLNHHEWHQERLYPYLKNMKSQGLAFEEDADDPAVIAQIKKIINLLQLAEEVLLDVEKMGDDRSFFELFQEINLLKTSDKLYELCQLLMWPDIDLLSEFKEEYQWIQIFFEPIFFKRSFKDDSLMDLKTALAQYVNDWVEHFQTQLSLREEKSHAYSLEAKFFALLAPLERLSRKQLLRFGIVGDLHRTLKHGHSIIWKLCYDINHLEHPNQRRVKETLNEFRMTFCLPLLSFLDKCEEKLILVPGGLSNLAQTHFERLFGVMTTSLKRFIHLDKEEETLVNSAFMKKRLGALYDRRAQIRLQDAKSRVFLLGINEDILNNVNQMQRLFKHSEALLGFSSHFSPTHDLEREYLHYLKQHEIFLQAKSAYIQFIHHKAAGYRRYDDQIRRHLFERLKPLWPDKNLCLDDVMLYQSRIEQMIVVEEKRFSEGLSYYEACWARRGISENKEPKLEIKSILNQTIDTFLEQYQSLYGMFNEETQTLLKPAEDSFLINLSHKMTGSVNKLPYPEVSDPKAILSEPQSLVWIKRLANIAVHLSKALQQCTRFERTPRHQNTSGLAYQRAKASCLANIVIVEHHARNALWALFDLDQDDYFHHFYTKRLAGAKQLHHQVMKTIPHQKISQVKPLIQEALSLFEKLHPQVSLFLHLPQVVDLLFKVKVFVQDTRAENPNIIRKKLKEMESIFTSILIEADACEERLLLKEGAITKPLIHILSHYQQKFLNIDVLLLEMDKEMFHHRLKALQKRMAGEEAETQVWIEKKLCAVSCRELNTEDKALMMKVAALLKEANPRCHVAYQQCAQAEEVEKLLAMNTNTPAINRSLLKQLIEIYLMHCEGVIKGKALVKHAMLKKNEALEKKVHETRSRQASQADILSMKEVRQAVLGLRRYMMKQYQALQYAPVTGVFESQETLQKKADCLKQLEDILDNKQLISSEKFAQMQSIVQNPTFKQTLLAYHQYNFFSFQWLWQALWRLLSALSLYKPPCQKAYTTLTEAVHSEPPHRCGFFREKDETQNSKEGLYSYITTPR